MKTEPLTPIPYRPDDEPLVCLKVNRYWLAVVHAAVYPMRYPEAWTGSFSENKQARQDVVTLLGLLLDERNCEDMSCCDGSDLIISVMHRVSPDDNSTLQASIDGGLTWHTDPADPRNAVVIPSTNNEGLSVEIARCDKAENIVQFFQAMVNAEASRTGTIIEIAFQILADLIALLLLPEGVGAAILVLIYPIANAVKQLGEEAYKAIFTETVWDAVRCAAYCTLPEHGNMTIQQWKEFAGRVSATVDGTAGPLSPAANLLYMIAATGYPGTLLATVTGTSNGADCSSCDCGTCDSSDMSAYQNTVPNELSIIDSHHVEVTSVFYAGSHRVMVCTGGHTLQADGGLTNVQHEAPCYIAYETVSGTVTISNASIDEKSFDERSFFFPSGNYTWMVELLGTAEFTVRFSIG